MRGASAQVVDDAFQRFPRCWDVIDMPFGGAGGFLVVFDAKALQNIRSRVRGMPMFQWRKIAWLNVGTLLKCYASDRLSEVDDRQSAVC